MTTHEDYNQLTPGSDVAAAFGENIKGRNVVITGVSPKSLGGTLATTLAKHSPGRLILASRTQAKLDEVVKTIKHASPDIRVDTVLLDLSSQASVRTAAKEIENLLPNLDILINNAAIMDPEHHYTTENIELQFGTNHIGHFLLTNLLLPLLKTSAQHSSPGSTRVINVSSQGYRLSPIRFHDYNFQGHPIPDAEQPAAWVPKRFLTKPGREYSGFLSYGQSKTANILFSLELTQQLSKEGVRSYAVHPGTIDTGLSRNLSEEDAAIIAQTADVWVDHDQGTATILVAALDPALCQSDGGVFLSACRLEETLSHASDPNVARRLWVLSEELTGLDSLGTKL